MNPLSEFHHLPKQVLHGGVAGHFVELIVPFSFFSRSPTPALRASSDRVRVR
jgi:hypothetical protein